jgi:hypothetical protein
LTIFLEQLCLSVLYWVHIIVREWVGYTSHKTHSALWGSKFMADNVSGRLVSFDIPDTKVSVIGSEAQKFVKALDVLVFFVALLLALPPFVAVYRSMSQVPQGEVVQTDSSAAMTLD